jgi:hypothetical protein
MTRYAPLWQQAGTYPAGTDRGLLGALWPASGSTGGAATTIANTMQVSVAPGTAAVALGTAGALTQLCRWDAAEVVTLVAAPPAGSSRIDLVVLQVRDNTLDSGGNNDFIFQAIAGAGGTPGPGAVPAVPNNAYPVAQLTVPGGAANLNGVTVVDRRITAGLMMPTLVGYVQPLAPAQVGSAFTDVAGMSITFTAVAGHRYRLTVDLNVLTATAGGVCNARITDGANNTLVGADFGATVPLAEYAVWSWSAWATPPAGAITYKVRAQAAAAGLLQFNSYQIFEVVDFGPA